MLGRMSVLKGATGALGIAVRRSWTISKGIRASMSAWCQPSDASSTAPGRAALAGREPRGLLANRRPPPGASGRRSFRAGSAPRRGHQRARSSTGCSQRGSSMTPPNFVEPGPHAVGGSPRPPTGGSRPALCTASFQRVHLVQADAKDPLPPACSPIVARYSFGVLAVGPRRR